MTTTIEDNLVRNALIGGGAGGGGGVAVGYTQGQTGLGALIGTIIGGSVGAYTGYKDVLSISTDFSELSDVENWQVWIGPEHPRRADEREFEDGTLKATPIPEEGLAVWWLFREELRTMPSLSRLKVRMRGDPGKPFWIRAHTAEDERPTLIHDSFAEDFKEYTATADITAQVIRLELSAPRSTEPTFIDEIGVEA